MTRRPKIYESSMVVDPQFSLSFPLRPANRGVTIMDVTNVASASGSLEVAREFVKRINAHDVEALVALMSPNYVFADSLGNEFPSATAREGCKQYFSMVPDYWIQLSNVAADGDSALLFGRAGDTFVPSGGTLDIRNHWEAPEARLLRHGHSQGFLEVQAGSSVI